MRNFLDSFASLMRGGGFDLVGKFFETLAQSSGAAITTPSCKSLLLTSIALVLVPTSGCIGLGSIFYSGDGYLTDYGPGAAHNRYVLDLGPVDLRAEGTFDYDMRNLPNAELILGFRLNVSDNERSLLVRQPVDALVSVELRKADGEVMVGTVLAPTEY